MTGYSGPQVTTVGASVQALQDIHWHAAEPALAFHPRAYNLSLAGDFASFDLDFKWTAAASLLRLLLRHGGFHRAALPDERTARVALCVCQTRLRHMRSAPFPPPPPPPQSLPNFDTHAYAAASCADTACARLNRDTIWTRLCLCHRHALFTCMCSSVGFDRDGNRGESGCRRDLVEEDVAGGCSLPLPDLSEEEWGLLLNAPAFRMSTSMQYTSKHRRRNPSSRTISSAGRSSAASSRTGQARPGGAAPGSRDGAAAEAAESSSSSGSDFDEDSDEEVDGGEEEEEEETEQEARRRAQQELEADTARAMHFGTVEEQEVEKMSAALRAEVWPSAAAPAPASAALGLGVAGGERAGSCPVWSWLMWTGDPPCGGC